METNITTKKKNKINTTESPNLPKETIGCVWKCIKCGEQFLCPECQSLKEEYCPLCDYGVSSCMCDDTDNSKCKKCGYSYGCHCDSCSKKKLPYYAQYEKEEMVGIKEESETLSQQRNEQWTLKDKIKEHPDWQPASKFSFYWESDVKEFIRLLKKKGEIWRNGNKDMQLTISLNDFDKLSGFKDE